MNTEFDYWLEKLRHGRWMLHLGGIDARRPDWIAAQFQWHDCADVVIIRAEDSAVAFRTPTDETTDVLNPDTVKWVYGDDKSAVWVLRAALSLPSPGSPHEPYHLIDAPPACRIPPGGRRPVTMRPR
ncbi:MAG TPA: hypothetical protein VFV67_26590 [Actinophytocola sp.]|uniref:hypothetical protein n=1 Tax=Actinophytocola sp. TaxID=1872138 RepID=UPI002DBDACA0|nr:hypothetical protein [Actinophytocola sp.]HEU5474231.1 hypothetical protein [Actinophytocola sp.]